MRLEFIFEFNRKAIRGPINLAVTKACSRASLHLVSRASKNSRISVSVGLRKWANKEGLRFRHIFFQPVVISHSYVHATRQLANLHIAAWPTHRARPDTSKYISIVTIQIHRRPQSVILSTLKWRIPRHNCSAVMMNVRRFFLHAVQRNEPVNLVRTFVAAWRVNRRPLQCTTLDASAAACKSWALFHHQQWVRLCQCPRWSSVTKIICLCTSNYVFAPLKSATICDLWFWFYVSCMSLVYVSKASFCWYIFP